MLSTIAYYQILGLPIVLYLGILTLLSFILTATIGHMNKKGINKIPFKWHSRMAKTSIGLALIHAILALSAYF